MVARRSHPADDDALRAYLRAIARAPRLAPEEEQALAHRIQQSHGRDDDALRRLVEGNLRFAVHYAKREEIGARLGLSPAEIESLTELGATDVSLSDLVAGEGTDGVHMEDTIHQVAVPPAEDDVIRRHLAKQLACALSELDEKEREIVRLRFGLTREGEPRTLQEIGDRLRLSRERIRQIESRAKAKLRHSKRAVGLRSYLN